MSRNSWRDISTRRPRGTGKQSTESNGGADSSSGSTPFLGKEYIKYRLRSAIGPRIPTGYVYPCKEIKGISKSQLSLRFRQEKTGWVHSQADRGKSKSKLLSGIFSWERDWVWTPPEAVPNQNCLWNGNHTI